MISVKIKGVAFDTSGNPMVLLTDINEERVLPIWVGVLEANSIAVALEQLNLPRPMTHDLMLDLSHILGAKMIRAIISDLKDNTFYAEICLIRENREIVLDARPSDAIALALRADAPIYVHDSIVDHMLQITEIIDEGERSELEKLASELTDDYKKTLH